MASKKGTPAKAQTLDERWYRALEEPWKELLAKEHEIDSAKKLKRVKSIRDVYIDDESEITTLAPLEAFDKLEELNCDGKKISDLSPLAKVPKLKSLRITSPIKRYDVIAKMTALEALDLTDSQIADLAPLAALSKLERLDLADTPVHDLAPIAGLKKLDRVSIARTKVTDLSPLVKLAKLSHLDVTDTPIADFAPLAKLKKLGYVELGGTPLDTIEPLRDLDQIYILDVARTKLRFEDVIRYFAIQFPRRKSHVGLTYRSDYDDPDAMVRALEDVRFSLDGLETALTVWVNDRLIGIIKSEKHQKHARDIVDRFFRLDVKRNDYTNDILAHALHVAVTQDIGAENEARVLALVPERPSRLLAYNLACFHARRKNKSEMLRFAKISLSEGQEAAKFQADDDFSAYRSDPDFVALLSEIHLPDPSTQPLVWWRGAPEEIQHHFHVEEETDEAVRAALSTEDVRLYLSDMRNLDYLRNLDCVTYVSLPFCRASSIDAIGTLRNLKELEWSHKSYDTGPKLKDISALASCASLEKLILDGHDISDLSALASLSLVHLNVRENPIRSLDDIARIRTLKMLMVDVTEPFDTAPLAQLPNVESLWLMGPAKSLAGLRSLKKLHSLWMQKLVPEDGSFEPLFDVKSLRKVWVGDARVKEMKKLFRTHLPECEVL